MKVLHVIPNTYVGGAEIMLEKLISQLDPAQVQSVVISLGECGPIGQKLRDQGIPVHPLNWLWFKRVPDPLVAFRLLNRIRRERPDVVQTWMYHADFLGGLAARCLRLPVIWNIRHATLDPAVDSRNMCRSASLCAKISRWVPQRIILNSESAAPTHIRAGYDSSKFHIIHNGFDTTQFQPSCEHRTRIRQELGIAEDALVVGIVGRFHPHKDHRNFIQAGERLLQKLSPRDLHFVLVGDGIDETNPDLMGMISTEFRARCRLLGRRDDIPQILASLDISVCCSQTESFPNVVGEAMSCGIPCVVTDVGDSARIVGNARLVVPPGDPSALAIAMELLLARTREQRLFLGLQGRKRIEKEFSLPRIVERYLALWNEVASPRQLARAA